MRRRLFTLTSALSLLLFVATCVLWGLSYWRSFGVGTVSLRESPLGRTTVTRTLTVDSGAVLVAHDSSGPDGITPQQRRIDLAYEPGIHWWNERSDGYPSLRGHTSVLGIGAVRTHRSLYGIPVDEQAVIVPLWLPSALFGALALPLLRRFGKRGRGGHCHQCGYDLRATPDRCPECGTLVPQKDATA
jgi:hypothetical protein